MIWAFFGVLAVLALALFLACCGINPRDDEGQ